jgi:CBS domain containing-hemolysin-like protein
MDSRWKIHGKKIVPGTWFKSPVLSLILALASVYMLIRYIQLFTTSEDPAVHLLLLLLWAVMAIICIVLFICQIIPYKK